MPLYKRKSGSKPGLRHCMVVFSVYPLGETRVQREAETLVRNGYEVDVICFRLPGESAVDCYQGVTVYREEIRIPVTLSKISALGKRFYAYLQFFLSAAIRVTRLHLQNHYGTIQVHNLPDFLVFCTLVPKLLGIPILLDLHDLMPEFYAGRFGQRSSFTLQLIQIQERLACRFADHVITVSEHWRQALIKRGVPADKCSVIMNVPDNQLFYTLNSNNPRAQTRQEFQLVYHGSMHERYGLDLAVQAIDRVRHEIPEVHLSLIGDGPFLPVLKAMVSDLDLNEYIHFEPLRLAEELPGIIRSCDLGIVPYRSDIFTDGLLPTKLMEYAALGIPAIAARTTAIREYFSGANVELFEPGNVEDLARCIMSLYHDPERMANLARGSQNFNQRYNWAKIGDAYVALVSKLRSGI